STRVCTAAHVSTTIRRENARMTTMTLTAETMMNIFEMVGGDLQEIHGDARGYTLGSWKTLQLVKGASLGASVAVIPFSGAVLLPAEFLALMRTMHRSALGVCAIHHDYVDAEQFANILAVWAGEATLTQALG